MSSDPVLMPNIQDGLLKAIKTLPAQTLLYGSALLTIAAIDGAALPGILATLATTIGVNVLSNMLERIARGYDVSDDEIRQTVESAIRDSGIEELVTSNEFQRAIGRVFRQFDLLKYAIQKGEITVVTMLSEQFEVHRGIQEELQNELSLVREELKNLSTREQSDDILKYVQRIAENQETILGNFQPTASSQSFSIALVDEKIEENIERLRKSRFFLEFDRAGFSLTFGEKLKSGEFSGGTPSLRSRALAWCSRVLSYAEEINKADEYFNIAKQLGGEEPEIEIAHAFVLSQRGDKSAALKILADIDSPIARTAAYIIVAKYEGQSGSVDWLNKAGIAVSSLDSDGKRFHLAQLLELAQWDSALKGIDELAEQDLEETPIINHLVAITYLLSAIPDELRKYVYVQMPLEVATFPLDSSVDAIAARRNALAYFNVASQVAKELNCSNAATIDSEYALWLELTDPEGYPSAKRKLEGILRSPKRSLRYVNLAVQFGVKLSLELVEREIEQQIAINGGFTVETAIARFALVYTKKTPEDAAIYISQHQDQLIRFLDKKYLLLFQFDMFLKAGLIDKAKNCLNILLIDGISEEEENGIRRRLSEFEGSDAVEVRKEQFIKSNSLIDLVHLIDELEVRRDWTSLCEYGHLLFERTHSLHDAERFAHSLSFTHDYEKMVGFLATNKALLSQSKILQFYYCLSLYYEGALLEARSELKTLDTDWDNPNYRMLQINLRIASGDWNSLLPILANELAEKDKRSAQELLFAAQLAINVNSSHSKELIHSAADKGKDDAGVLSAAYFLASSAGLETEEGVFRWIERAAELSGDDGPIQRMTLKDILDRKPEWDQRESDTWKSLSRGEISMFVAARLLNKTLIDMVLFPALINLTQKDPRRKGIVAAFSGNRQSKSFENCISVGLDSTTLLNLSFLNLLEKVFDMFDMIYLPHSTLLWLFEEKRRSMFHQPSRIRDAHKISQLLLSGALEKLVPSTEIDSELSAQVGDELAQLIAEAIKHSKADSIQHVVVRSSPVHQVKSLMEDEADLTKYEVFLSSCQFVVERLRQKGQITGEEERRATAYLRLQEKQWANQPEITDGAVLYLDDVTVSYFLHLGILDKLSAAGYKTVISPRKVSETKDLISFEEISGKFNEVIERIRFVVNSKIQSGKIKIGRQQNFDEGEPQSLFQHPTVEIIGLANICDAIIVDDRSVNRHGYIGDGDVKREIFTSLDLLDNLVLTGVISDVNRLESTTLLRRAGYFFLPVNYDDLMTQLVLSQVKEDNVVETAELKAMRENILRVRMSSWLQLPHEALWLDTTIEIFIRVLKNLWKSDFDLSSLKAKSNWITDQIDIRGWAHRLDNDLGDNLVKTGRGTHILLLLMPLRDISEDIQQEYRKWAEERILMPIRESNPELYSWISNWQRTQIAAIANMDLDEIIEDSNE
jgi:hypothetical protein